MRALKLIAPVLAAAVALTSLVAPLAPVAAKATQGAGKCDVVVDRSQVAGTFDVTRQTFENHCRCYIYTGPASQPESVEQQIAQIQEDRQCPNGVPMAIAGPGPSAVAGPKAVAGKGFFPFLIAPLAAATGLGIAASNNSGTPANPVSP